jgi:aconitate hydratase
MIDLASRAGHPVAAVVLGPLATPEDLAEFAHALRERPVAATVRVEWRPAGRAQHEALVGAGLEPMLRAAGIVIVEPGAPLPSSGAGAHMAFGVDPSALHTPDRTWWIAGVSALAVSAITGKVTPPEVPGVARELLRSPSASLPRPTEVAQEVAAARVHVHEEPQGTIPLTVACVLEDDVPGAEFLPWGARLEGLRHDPHALSRHVLGGVDPGFAERARALRPALIVGGHRLGAGPIHPAAAPALRELGVRAVFAVSFAPEFRRRVIEVGILPLLLPRAEERDGFACGDRVELPSLALSLEPGRALLARNLLRGGRVVLEHDLDPLAIAVVRVGGLLALGREERGRWTRADTC